MKKIVLLVLSVLLLVLSPAILVTGSIAVFLMPESFSSRADVAIAGTNTAIGTEVLRVKSTAVLSRTVTDLSLAEVWGKQFKAPGSLRAAEAEAILRSRIDVSAVPNSSVLSILAFEDTPEAAAELANGVASNFVALVGSSTATVITPATPNMKPARPNKPLAIGMSALFSGVFAAAGILTMRAGLKKSKPEPTKTVAADGNIS